MNLYDKIINYFKNNKISVFIVLLFLGIIQINSIFQAIDSICKYTIFSYNKIFPPKFSNNRSFNILILPFNLLSGKIDYNLKIEKSIEIRFKEIIDINHIPLEVIFDENEKHPESVENAQILCKKRNADLIIYGDFYDNDKDTINEIRIKWVLAYDLHSYLGIKRDSKVQPIKRLSQLSNGYLLNDIEYIVNWAIALRYLKQQNYKLAIKTFYYLLTKFKLLANNEIGLYHGIGLCYNYLGDYNNAKFYYEKSIEIDSNFAPAYNNLGIILAWNIGDFEKAKNCFIKSLEISNNNPIILENIAWLFQKHYKDYDNAVYYYKKSIAYDSLNVLAYQNLAFIYDYYLNDYYLASQYYQKSIEINSNIGLFHENYAIFLGRKLNDFDNAIKHHNMAIILDSKLASPYNSLGNIYAFVYNDINKASKYFVKAIYTNPDFPEPYTVYGMILCEYYKNIAKGKEYLIKSLELFDKFDVDNPNRTCAYNNLALFFDKYEKNYNKAKELLCEAISIDSNAFEPLANLFYIYYFKLNDTVSANRIFLKIKYIDTQLDDIEYADFVNIMRNTYDKSNHKDSLTFDILRYKR